MKVEQKIFCKKIDAIFSKLSLLLQNITLSQYNVLCKIKRILPWNFVTLLLIFFPIAAAA